MVEVRFNLHRAWAEESQSAGSRPEIKMDSHLPLIRVKLKRSWKWPQLGWLAWLWPWHLHGLLWFLPQGLADQEVPLHHHKTTHSSMFLVTIMCALNLTPLLGKKDKIRVLDGTLKITQLNFCVLQFLYLRWEEGWMTFLRLQSNKMSLYGLKTLLDYSQCIFHFPWWVYLALQRHPWLQ